MAGVGERGPAAPPPGHRSRDRAALVFVHSSDELYGADRMLLEVLDALEPSQRARAQCWLPTDLAHPAAPLCREIEARGVPAVHLPLPVLRRADLTPRGLLRLAGRSTRLLRDLRALRPALVYCTTSAVLPVVPLARLAGVRRVVLHVQELWSAGEGRVLGGLATGCDRLVAISDPVRERLPRRLARRTVVVPNATPEPTGFVPLSAHDGPLRLVVASRWNAWKGHRTLLGAWDRLDAPGRLTVLGGPPPSGESVDVPALVRRLRHPASVDVVGEVTDPDRYLGEADVVVVPSDQPEPFGLVAIEAFARGRPVVGSRGGGLAQIVTDGVDGWLFPPGDVAALGTLLAGLTRDRVEAAGARARETYESRYTGERYAAAWQQAVRLPR